MRTTQTPAPAGMGMSNFATCGVVGSSPRPTSVQASLAPGCLSSLFPCVFCYVHARGLHPSACSAVPECVFPAHIWKRLRNSMLPHCAMLILSLLPCVHARLRACSAARACLLRCSRVRPGHEGALCPGGYKKIYQSSPVLKCPSWFRV